MARRWMRTVDRLLWGAALATAAVIAYLMLAPEPPGGGTMPSWAAHLLVYCAQSFVTLLAAVWRPGGPPGRRVSAALVVAAVIVYGAALELAQWAIPERQTELADLAANALGAASGFGAWHLLRHRSR